MTKKAVNNKKQLKYFILLVVALLALLLFLDLFTLGTNIFNLKKRQTTSIDHLARLIIYSPDGKAKTFSGEVIKDMTILDALTAASQGGGPKIDYEDKSWKLSLNGHSIDIGKISTIKISGGDVIRLKLNVTK